jgi:hypothetical protein
MERCVSCKWWSQDIGFADTTQRDGAFGRRQRYGHASDDAMREALS